MRKNRNEEIQLQKKNLETHSSANTFENLNKIKYIQHAYIYLSKEHRIQTLVF